jgi:hypothetical protein
MSMLHQQTKDKYGWIVCIFEEASSKMVINLPLLTEHASYNQNTQKYNSTKTLKPSNEKDSFHICKLIKSTLN